MKLTLQMIPLAEIPEEWKDGRPLLAFKKPDNGLEMQSASVPVLEFGGSDEADSRWRVVWWRIEKASRALPSAAKPRGEWAYAVLPGSYHGGAGELSTVEPDFLAELPAWIKEPGHGDD